MYHRATGRRLTLVAESEGALLAKAYLAATPGAPVANLVILSPLLEPGTRATTRPTETRAGAWAAHS